MPKMPDSPDAPRARAVNVKIDDDVQGGVYANKLIVAHSREEFVLDFVADFPPGPRIVARVVTTPGHLRSFIDALRQNLERWEGHHGAAGRGPTTPAADA